MSGNYRDEGTAALAANEALRHENEALKSQLEQAQRQQQAMLVQHQQQLAMAQQGYPVPAAPSTGARNVVLIAAVLGMASVCMGAGVILWLTTARPVPPPLPVEYTPQPAPTGLRPDGLPHGTLPGATAPVAPTPAQ